MNKRNIKIIGTAFLLTAIFVTSIFCLSGCLCREADKVNYNLSKDADYFNCERRITVYNARTDKIIFVAEGYMALSNNSTNEIVATFKVGANEYKKNYIYLNENTLYVVEDISGTHTDPYHYQVTFNTSFPIDIETKP